MWLGEQITQGNVGNGMSLIIITGIVANIPLAFSSILDLGHIGALSVIFILFLIVMEASINAFVVFMERAQRRIVVQYPKRQVSNKTFGGGASHLPLKVHARMLPRQYEWLVKKAKLHGWWG